MTPATFTLYPSPRSPHPAASLPRHESWNMAQESGTTLRVGVGFFVPLVCMCICREKKIDSPPNWLNSLFMPDQKKQEYYKTNRDSRLTYQKAYYRNNAQLVKRKRELQETLEPEKYEKQREYQRAYYLENRARIREHRANRAKEASSVKTNM